MKSCTLPIVCILIFVYISLSVEAKLDCTKPVGCLMIWEPVCGSDGTYMNGCFFDGARCQRENLRFLHKGECKKGKMAPGQSSPGGSKKSVCVCTKEYKPVCGNNSKLYPNMCELRCAQKTNKELRHDRSRKPENNCKGVYGVHK